MSDDGPDDDREPEPCFACFGEGHHDHAAYMPQSPTAPRGDEVIRFFVAGVPKTMSVGTAFRFKRNGVDTHVQGRRGTEWATLIGHVGRQHAPERPSEVGAALTLRFFVPRPASAPRSVKLPLKRPDLDNLFHKLSDSWNGVFWKDDSQVVDLIVRKRFARDGRVGVEVVIEPVFEP